MVIKIAARFFVTAASLTLGVATYPARIMAENGPRGPDRDSPGKKALLEALMSQISKRDGPAYLEEIYKKRAENFELFQALHSYHLREEIELQDRIIFLAQRWCRERPLAYRDRAEGKQSNAADDLQETWDVIKLLESKVHNRRYLKDEFRADGRSRRLKLPSDFYGTREVNALLFEGWEIELEELKKLGELLEKELRQIEEEDGMALSRSQG